MSFKQPAQFGLSEVYTSIDPLVDIVLVHGLNGHPYKSWATSNVYWPVDLLPQFIEEQRCRILTYGYDANVSAFTEGVSKDNIHNHAEHLAGRLVANRSLKKALERPLIFICHSLGGLVVKRCLIYCKSLTDTKTERLRSVYVSTYGILFLGTPHNGSDMAKWGTLLQSIAHAALPKKFFDSSPQLIEALKSNNETLQNINRLFVEIIPRFHIYFFHESKPMDLKGTLQFVVDEDSAAPITQGVERMGIERDHSHMCKFEDENSPGFDVVAEAIQRYADDAPMLIMTRWDEEKRIREFERQGAARELLGVSNLTPEGSPIPSKAISLGTTSPSPKLLHSPYEVEEYEDVISSKPKPAWSVSSPCMLSLTHVSTEGSIKSLESQHHSISDVPLISISTPLLVAPLGFRPNSVFVGFSIEIARIHHKLQNKKRADLGSGSVVVCGPPGCGKSHLAREYVWQHRFDYPAGIFWVDCKSQESLHKCFWDIGQAVGCLNNGQESFVENVRKWLEKKQGWLLVFDGVSFDKDEDIQDFVRYIPDAKGNSIIFTTVDQTLANRQRLLDPPSIKVYPLSEQDACLLLFKSLNITKPNHTQSVKAKILVNHYECLPLGVHAAAHMLLARGRALEKYSVGPSDARLASPYLDLMSALQENNHPEAVNLVMLLSFLSHTVPVALLQFGSKALEMEILSGDPHGSLHKDLDNTIVVLLRYGFVERSLQAYSVPSSEGRSSPEQLRHITSFPEPTRQDSVEDSSSSITASIDVIRIHTVVQNVLREEVQFTDKENYYGWLIATVRLLVNSFDVAYEKMRMSSGGLVRDYREFETHAAKLWSYFPKHSEEASPSLIRARSELHQMLRLVRREIQNRSPSQSSHHSLKTFGSIFERSGSSSEEPHTPSTGSWSIADSTESPIEYHADWNIPTSRRESNATEVPSRQMSLHAIFQGHQNQQVRKDLGEWKAVAVMPAITSAQASPIRSRDSSTSRPHTANSEAELALNAVHQRSPSLSKARMASPIRQSLIERPANQNRNPSSPRLVQAVLSNQAALAWDELPQKNRPWCPQYVSGFSDYEYRSMPTGYTSTPMSRDTSQESHTSLQPVLPIATHHSVLRQQPVDMSRSVDLGGSLPPIDASSNLSRSFPGAGLSFQQEGNGIGTKTEAD